MLKEQELLLKNPDKGSMTKTLIYIFRYQTIQSVLADGMNPNVLTGRIMINDNLGGIEQSNECLMFG